MWLAGVDGCRGGWVVVFLHGVSGELRARRVRQIDEILSAPEQPEVICVDIPIGLLDAAQPGGRHCDSAARALLGVRRASVFSAPVRAVLSATSHAEANRRSKTSSAAGIGLSQQAFGIAAAIAQVDAVMTPALQQRVYEVHPELSFREMNAGQPMAAAKRTAAGAALRRDCLLAAGLLKIDRVTGDARPVGSANNDVLDALAAVWTARRIKRGVSVRVPEAPPLDARGLRMEIVR